MAVFAWDSTTRKMNQTVANLLSAVALTPTPSAVRIEHARVSAFSPDQLVRVELDRSNLIESYTLTDMPILDIILISGRRYKPSGITNIIKTDMRNSSVSVVHVGIVPSEFKTIEVDEVQMSGSLEYSGDLVVNESNVLNGELTAYRYSLDPRKLKTIPAQIVTKKKSAPSIVSLDSVVFSTNIRAGKVKDSSAFDLAAIVKYDSLFNSLREDVTRTSGLANPDTLERITLNKGTLSAAESSISEWSKFRVPVSIRGLKYVGASPNILVSAITGTNLEPLDIAKGELVKYTGILPRNLEYNTDRFSTLYNGSVINSSANMTNSLVRYSRLTEIKTLDLLGLGRLPDKIQPVTSNAMSPGMLVSSLLGTNLDAVTSISGRMTDYTSALPYTWTNWKYEKFNNLSQGSVTEVLVNSKSGLGVREDTIIRDSELTTVKSSESRLWRNLRQIRMGELAGNSMGDMLESTDFTADDLMYGKLTQDYNFDLLSIVRYRFLFNKPINPGINARIGSVEDPNNYLRDGKLQPAISWLRKIRIMPIEFDTSVTSVNREPRVVTVITTPQITGPIWGGSHDRLF